MEHTQSKWEVTATCDTHLVIDTPAKDANEGYIVARAFGPDREANAKLIAEAGAVANETGFTPRQLADQKAGLLEALKLWQKWFYADRDIANISSEMLLKMDKALAKATD